MKIGANQGHHRQRVTLTLRVLFRTLKKQRLVFADPTRGIHVGAMRPQPATPLPAHLVAQAAHHAAGDPVLRVILALAGIHALNAGEVQTLRLDQLQPAAKRIQLRGAPRPLDPYTEQAISDYLAYRHAHWPHTANPQLLVNRTSANGLAPVTHTWLHTALRQLGLTVGRLKEDRVLEEAFATGTDPLHLSIMFGLSHGAGQRYAESARDALSSLALPGDEPHAHANSRP